MLGPHLMSSITHILFVSVWYCKQIWLEQQSGTLDSCGNDYRGRWNLHPFSLQQSAICLEGMSTGNIPKWSWIGTDTLTWCFPFFFYLPMWVLNRIGIYLGFPSKEMAEFFIFPNKVVIYLITWNTVMLCFCISVEQSKMPVKTHVNPICP